MNARNRVFMILGLLTLGSLIWYLVTARSPSDLRLIGTVDANEVLVSAKIPQPGCDTMDTRFEEEQIVRGTSRCRNNELHRRRPQFAPCRRSRTPTAPCPKCLPA